jgi:hypothetical protein
MEELITLVCPVGETYSFPICSHDRSFEPYRAAPGDRWLVDVTPAAAAEFLHKGGFALPEFVNRRVLSGQTTPLVHTDGPFSVSFDGVEYVSQETAMPNGEIKHVMAFPSEGVAEIVDGVHPGVSVLSLADFMPPAPPPDPSDPPAPVLEDNASSGSKSRRSRRESGDE